MSVDKKIRRLDEKIDKLRIKFKDEEDFKVVQSVFDRRTLITLYKLARDGYIDVMNGIISTGKEANVYWAKNSDGEDVAVKIYRITTLDYRKMATYIEGDPRFKTFKKKTHALVYEWAKKEYKNLYDARNVGVRVPNPIIVEKNVLIMEFIGEDGVPAPLLKEVEPEEPEKVLDTIVNYMEKLYKGAELVHGDLSEYNIMYLYGEVVFIDMSQSVKAKHPHSLELLVRDIRNVLNYFRKLDVLVYSIDEVFEKVTGLNYNEYSIILENP